MNSVQPLAPSAERAAALLAALQESRADVEALLASLSLDDLARPSVCPGWSVRDEIGHIIDATEVLVRSLEQAADGEQEGMLRPREMAKEMQLSAVKRAALLPLPQLRLAYNQAAAKLLRLLETRDPARWDDGVPHPYLGTVPAVQFVGLALVDWFIHPWDIRKALDLKPTVNPRHATLLVAGVVGMMPRRLDASRARNARARFRYEVEEEGNPKILVNTLDVVLSKNVATIEHDAPSDISVELTFRGPASALVLAMLGRKGLSPFVLPARTNDTWLSRWSNLWISL